ncbi:MAG: pyridoxal phosphate-dependent aminotransferase [Muribaculaceae bacterium]|nr:pyridoxal phosphate-dependent aminotransferase [Muribaculaceae bacterium]
MNQYNFDILPERRGSGDIKFDELRNRYGRSDLYSLWVADMDFEVAPEIRSAMEKRINTGIFAYAGVSDSYWNAVMNWIRTHFGFSVTRAELSFIPGIVRGIGYAINYYTQKDDKILIQPPVYHPFRLLTESNGRMIVTNPLLLNSDGTYTMDFKGLEETVEREKPRMMILCNPHNPGGIRWTKEDLRRVAAIASRNNMIVISDEIHADLILSGEPHNSFFQAGEDAEKVGIVFGAPSKTFNIPGLVSSWAVIKNPVLRDGFYSWLTVNEFNDAPFTASIPTEAAYTSGEPWRKELINYLNGNLEYLIEYFKANMPKIKVLPPQASFLVWLDCRDMNLSQPELVDFFTNKAHLALNDGSMFGGEGTGFMRLNMGTSRKNLAEALASLKKAYDRL